MKISLASRISTWLGNHLVGRSEDLVGVDMPDLWYLSSDIDPPTPDEASDPAWKELRIAYAFLRRRLFYRVGYACSILLAGVFLVAMLFVGGVGTGRHLTAKKQGQSVAVASHNQPVSQLANSWTGLVAARERATKIPALFTAYCSLPADQKQNPSAPNCGQQVSPNDLPVADYYAMSASVCASGGDCSVVKQMVSDICDMSTAGSDCESVGLKHLKANPGDPSITSWLMTLCQSGKGNYCDERGGV